MQFFFINDSSNTNLYFSRFINANDIVCAVPLAASGTFGGSYCPEHRRKSVRRPAEFTLNDFKHVGDPIILGYRTGKLDQRERGVNDVFRGMINEICSTVEELFRIHKDNGHCLAKGLVLLNFATFGIFGLLRDHFPRYFVPITFKFLFLSSWFVINTLNFPLNSEYYENFKRTLKD